MSAKQLLAFRRREIEALRWLLGLDRVCPGAKAEYRRSIAVLRKQLKAVL